MPEPNIALVSREVHPFIGGGIAPIVRATATQLAAVANVTLFTTDAHRDAYAQLCASDDPFPGVRVVFVPEPPAGAGHYYDWLQAYSDRVFQTLLATYGEQGPDLIEFPDYLAEGFVTIQAKRLGEPALRDTTLAVRTHTTAEIVAVLNGHVSEELQTRAITEMERYCLRHADRLLCPGGDVHNTYVRFYGADALAPHVEIPDAFLAQPVPPDLPSPRSGPLRLLFLGRTERRKGIQNLIRALRGSAAPFWRLTVLGGDTATAPLGLPMRPQLEAMVAGDDRVTLLDAVPREEVGAVIAAHDAIVVPSLWECWPNVAREALLHGRPLLATPVGGLAAFVVPGVTGFLAADAGVDALRELIETHVGDPEPLRALAGSDGLRETLEHFTDPERIRAEYLALASQTRQPATPKGSAPLVSVIVPYFKMQEFVADTLDSIAAQTHPEVETIVVNDGSLNEADRVLEELGERPGVHVITQRNRGLGAARNAGVLAARGRYILPLDADDVIAPEFLERTVAALEGDPALAYAGTWSRYVDETLEPIEGADPGYTPLGNWSALSEVQNVCGTATSLLRRSLFDRGLRYSTDLTSYEDWLLFLELRQRGLLGDIIPRPLLAYRIRRASMLRTVGEERRARLYGEVRAHVAEAAVRWEAD